MAISNCGCAARTSCGTCGSCGCCCGCGSTANPVVYGTSTPCNTCPACEAATINTITPDTAAYTYECDADWPELCSVCDNEEAARLLKQLIADEDGKLTALHGYLYQEASLAETEPVVSAVMGEIAKVEMKHVSYLARAITALGGNPVFEALDEQWSTQFWGAENVEYSRFVRDILTANIEAEEAMVDELERLINVIPIAQVDALLRRVAADDRLHIAVQKRLLGRTAAV